MPELPDLTVYLEHLERCILGQELERIRIAHPFLLRSVEPAPSEAEGRSVTGLRRLGKRLVIALEGDIFLVLHLMIAGRLRWKPPGAKVPGRVGLAAFDFPDGVLVLTEAGTRRRASLHLVRGEAALAAHDPGGLEVMQAGEPAFAKRLRASSHTIKRALTDPRVFSGIGNAYSDEILHRARLSPFKRAGNINDEESGRLFRAVRETLSEWTERLRKQTGDRFPEKVTAFHAEMSVHGRFGQPCPVCGAPVQRVMKGENGFNYCPKCQTGGKILADRALSRLLREDWPDTLEALERLEEKREG